MNENTIRLRNAKITYLSNRIHVAIYILLHWQETLILDQDYPEAFIL